MHIVECFLSLIQSHFPYKLRPRSLEQFMWIKTTWSNLRLAEGVCIAKKKYKSIQVLCSLTLAIKSSIKKKKKSKQRHSHFLHKFKPKCSSELSAMQHPRAYEFRTAKVLWQLSSRLPSGTAACTSRSTSCSTSPPALAPLWGQTGGTRGKEQRAGRKKWRRATQKKTKRV